jgi:UDP:flavonoid glycosyltransferase YjiC (YdhE family)
MSRFLFVVPPLAGHVNPTVSVGQVLRARGHAVAWVAHPGQVRPLLPPDAQLFPLRDDVPEERAAEIRSRSNAVRGLASLKFLWEDFLVPLAQSMIPGVEAAVRDFRPGALVVDHQALAGAVVARRLQLPWATLATTSASVAAGLERLPKVSAWIAAQVAEVAGPAAASEARFDQSPRLVVVFSTEALIGQAGFPSHVKFVGPSLSERREEIAFPWDLLREGPRVLCTLGTVNAERGGRFFATVVEALRDEALQLIVVAPPEIVGAVPEHVLVRRSIPQLAVLPHVDAVICHAGHNTVCESLAHGLPLVVAPIRDDQPIVAQQVVNAGAGVRVRFGKVGPRDLRAAVRRVLDEPSFREAAARIRASFEAAGGAEAAATHLEELA